MGNRTDHNRKTCHLCSVLRHPAQAAKGRALTKHLTEHPLPVQQTGAGR
ncbi:hypothetical protein [Streptomyces luteogriseus]